MNVLTSSKFVEDETFSLQSLIQYVYTNFFGLLLLILTFFIVYFVDYISQLNSAIFSMQAPMHGITNKNQYYSPIKMSKKTKKP